MKRIFLLKGLDCPNCSAKIEKEVGELDGVQSSVVNLMKQTLTINVAPAAANTIASQIETIVHSHEPGVEVQEETIRRCSQERSIWYGRTVQPSFFPREMPSDRDNERFLPQVFLYAAHTWQH